MSNRVYCITTEELFDKAIDAVRKYGLNKWDMSKHLNGNTTHIRGYKFVIYPPLPGKTLKLPLSYRGGKKEYQKQYRDNNKEYFKEYKRTWQRNKRGEGGAHKFIDGLRTRQASVFKGRVSTTEGLGCNSIQLQAYIESLFTDGMNLSNHGRGAGKWHLDHIIPLSSYERDAGGGWDIHSEYNKKLIHYTNLQPMWESENLEKDDNIDENDLKIFLDRELIMF
jgi:hypothetical protein